MNALVVGGSSGIGLSIVLELLHREDVAQVYVLDKNPFPAEYADARIAFVQFDLTRTDVADVLSTVKDIRWLYITAGFGHLRYFQENDERYIRDSFAVNSTAPICIIRHFYEQLLSREPFYCGVMVSITGRLNSPMFSIYSATKAALTKFIEAVNVELEVQGSENKILEVSPGMIEGTGFYGKANDPSRTADLAKEIIARSEKREMLFIPKYEEVFKDVIRRYYEDGHKFGVESYEYKQKRIQKK
jgi:NAD(P)-dependent dehydrogenase (short-subunit alcohol dehydrogenase family)